MDIFSLVGHITVNYADAVSSVEKVSKSAKETAENLEDVDKKADDAGDSVKGAGKAAETADSGFSTWKATLANLASEAITKVVSGCAQLAEKMADITKSAVGHYAEYEQLVGGVETLFKDSSGQLVEYADKAYKTAGMSANQYMNTATSFAASLIQGLGGDTAKAVDVSNMAITDMSDNANKMGTDISSIQDAYQGFAKQNYTMLDNLKLGYGGTQSEMIRLINDSGVLGEKIESLDNVTFDQMIEAIHQIQNNLDITGTTAKEAGTTISGSWGSVQALFENILTKVGSKVAPTVMGFLQQLSDWLETVDWDAFADSVNDAFQKAFDWIQKIDFTSFFQKGMDGVEGFLDKIGGLIEDVPKIIQVFKDLLPLITGIAAGFAALKVSLAISSLISAVSKSWNAYKTANEGATIAQWLFNAALNANPIVIVVTLIAGLVVALITLWNTNEGFRDAVISAWEKIKEVFGDVVDALKEFFSDFADKAAEVWESVKETVGNGIDAIKEFFSGLVDSVKQAWDNIKTAISDRINAIKDTISNVFTAVVDTISSAWDTAVNILQVAIMLIGEVISAGFQIITLPWRFIWENCKEYIIAAWDYIKNAISTALEAVASTISGAWDAIVGFLSPILETIKNTFTAVWDSIKSTVVNVFNEIVSLISAAWSTILNVVSGALATVAAAFSAAWTAIKTTVSDAINAVKTVISNVLNTVKSTVSSALNAVKTTFTTIWDGIKSTVTDKINGVKTSVSNGLNGAKSTVSNVLGAIKDKFTSIFDGVKNTVSNAINKIKGYFNFSWSLPHLKLPHISISGSFSLSPPSVPHFGIDWYKKAMDGGMILDQPTIFGYNPKKNQFMAGGEAGSETVVGTESLLNMIESVVSKSNSDSESTEILKVIYAWMKNGGLRELMIDVLTNYVEFDVEGREVARLVRKYA